MQVSKWGNSLAVRFPAGLVQALDLKEGEEIDLHLVGARSFEQAVSKPFIHALAAPVDTKQMLANSQHNQDNRERYS